MVADNGKLFLHGSFCDGEDQICVPDAGTQAIVFDILLNHKRDGEDSAFPGFLLHDLQTVAVSVPDNIAKSQF